MDNRVHIPPAIPASPINVDCLPWTPIHQAPHDVWLLLRGSSGHRSGPKRYVTARFESVLTSLGWAQRFRDINGNPISQDGQSLPSEFVVLP